MQQGVAGAARLRLADLNSHLVCVICRGYLVDATTIVECLHSFCRSCLVRHLERVTACPSCEAPLPKARPFLHIRSDKALQDIVYKLVPGLYRAEMQRRRQFFAQHPEHAALASAEDRGEAMERVVFSPEDHFSLSLEYYVPQTDREGGVRASTEDWESCSSSRGSENGDVTEGPAKRFLQCPALFPVRLLKKFLRTKFELGPKHKVDVIHRRVCLPDDYTLMDVAYIYSWRQGAPMRFFYRIYCGDQETTPPLTKRVADEEPAPPKLERIVEEVRTETQAASEAIPLDTPPTLPMETPSRKGSEQVLPPSENHKPPKEQTSPCSNEVKPESPPSTTCAPSSPSKSARSRTTSRNGQAALSILSIAQTLARKQQARQQGDQSHGTSDTAPSSAQTSPPPASGVTSKPHAETTASASVAKPLPELIAAKAGATQPSKPAVSEISVSNPNVPELTKPKPCVPEPTKVRLNVPEASMSKPCASEHSKSKTSAASEFKSKPNAPELTKSKPSAASEFRSKPSVPESAKFKNYVEPSKDKYKPIQPKPVDAGSNSSNAAMHQLKRPHPAKNVVDEKIRVPDPSDLLKLHSAAKKPKLQEEILRQTLSKSKSPAKQSSAARTRPSPAFANMSPFAPMHRPHPAHPIRIPAPPKQRPSSLSSSSSPSPSPPADVSPGRNLPHMQFPSGADAAAAAMFMRQQLELQSRFLHAPAADWGHPLHPHPFLSPSAWLGSAESMKHLESLMRSLQGRAGGAPMFPYRAPVPGPGSAATAAASSPHATATQSSAK